MILDTPSFTVGIDDEEPRIDVPNHALAAVVDLLIAETVTGL